LSEGQRKQDIVDILEGDERRVSLWIEFVKDASLLEYHSGTCLISDKGASWIEEAIKEGLINGN
jgi:hypothetical protein